MGTGACASAARSEMAAAAFASAKPEGCSESPGAAEGSSAASPSRSTLSHRKEWRRLSSAAWPTAPGVVATNAWSPECSVSGYVPYSSSEERSLSGLRGRRRTGSPQGS